MAAMARTSALRRISDGFLPLPIVQSLFDLELYNEPPVLVNGWTLVHLAAALAAWRYGLTLSQYMGIHAGWELFQTVIGDNDLSKTEDLVDISIDTGVSVLPWIFG